MSKEAPNLLAWYVQRAIEKRLAKAADKAVTTGKEEDYEESKYWSDLLNHPDLTGNKDDEGLEGE